MHVFCKFGIFVHVDMCVCSLLSGRITFQNWKHLFISVDWLSSKYLAGNRFSGKWIWVFKDGRF